jgi:endonuclease/exonuclease/phosphatase family metal-dependent hydrolase
MVRLLAIAVAFACVFVFVARAVFPPPRSEIKASEMLSSNRGPLQILTWNLGYAGLGSEEDFLVDGGAQWRVSSIDRASSYRDSIINALDDNAAPIVLLQEAAAPSLMNRGIDLRSSVLNARPSSGFIYESQYRIRLPFGMGIETGLALIGDSVSRETATALVLPGGGGLNIGRRFPLLVHRFDHNGFPYTVLALHLSAFDTDGVVRIAQLKKAMQVAIDEYETGRRVILGGDFNFELMARPRQGQSDEADMAWLVPFPWDVLPAGWRIGSGATVSTFRSVDRPYAPGMNYEGSIDAFIVSPNIAGACVSVIDLRFRSSDHNPVLLTIADIENAGRPEVQALNDDMRLPECTDREASHSETQRG